MPGTVSEKGNCCKTERIWGNIAGPSTSGNHRLKWRESGMNLARGLRVSFSKLQQLFLRSNPRSQRPRSKTGATGTDPIGKNYLALKGCRWVGLRASISNWTLLNPRPKCQFSEGSLFCWRPRRDLNPCYRRESRPRVRNRLKLNGTDSPLGHLSDCGDGLSDC